MSRPQRCRRICAEPRFTKFSPEGIEPSELVCLSTDEYEVLRLVDYERKTHEECAKQMDISRTTVTEIYDSARKKLVSALVEGSRLEISGGNYRICDGAASCCCGGGVCRRDFDKLAGSPGREAVIKKTSGSVRIALPCEDGSIYPHFGHAAFFELCDVKEGKTVLKTLLPNSSGGKGAIPELLKKLQVNVLICGGIGSGAVKLLTRDGISVISGISGSTEDAVRAYLENKLSPSGGAVCSGREGE